MISINDLQQMAASASKREAFEPGRYNFRIVHVDSNERHEYAGGIIGERVTVTLRFTSGQYAGETLRVDYSIGHPKAKSVSSTRLQNLYLGATFGEPNINKDQDIDVILTNREVCATLKYDASGKYPELLEAGRPEANLSAPAPKSSAPRTPTTPSDLPYDDNPIGDMY